MDKKVWSFMDDFSKDIASVVIKHYPAVHEEAPLIAFVADKLVRNPNFSVTLNKAFCTDENDNPTTKVNENIHIDFKGSLPYDSEGEEMKIDTRSQGGVRDVWRKSKSL